MVELKLSEKQRRCVAAGMAVLAGLMAISVLYQGAMHLVWRSWLKEASATLAAPTTQPAESRPASTPANAKQGRANESRPPKIAAAITRRNIFVPPPQTGHGLTLTGVIGRIALFNSRDGRTIGIQEGEAEQGVKVVSISNYDVTIEFKDKRETLKVFAGGAGEAMPAPESGPGVRPAEGSPARIEMHPGGEVQNMPPEVIEARKKAHAMRVRGPEGRIEVRTDAASQTAP